MAGLNNNTSMMLYMCLGVRNERSVQFCFVRDISSACYMLSEWLSGVSTNIGRVNLSFLSCDP